MKKKEHFIRSAALRLLIQNNDGLLVKEEKSYHNGEVVSEVQEYLIPQCCLDLFVSFALQVKLIPYLVRKKNNGIHVGLKKIIKKLQESDLSQYERFDKYPKEDITNIIRIIEQNKLIRY